MSLNRVTLIGNLGRDPEIRSFQNGGRAATLAIATNERWRDKSTGEYKEKTEWHRVVVYTDSTVGYIERNLRKGSRVYVEGQLETRKWTDQQGQERYITEIVVRAFKGEIQLLDRREANGETAPTQNGAPRTNGGFNGPRTQPHNPGYGDYSGRGRAPVNARGGRFNGNQGDDIPF